MHLEHNQNTISCDRRHFRFALFVPPSATGNAGPWFEATRTERTFWEKALILHGVYCGFRDQQRRSQDNNLISRHYYDVAVMRQQTAGRNALDDGDLLARVRQHKQLLFSRAWERLEEAIPGTLHLVPQQEIRAALSADYDAMSGMMFGDPPTFDWILQELAALETAINNPAPIQARVAAIA